MNKNFYLTHAFWKKAYQKPGPIGAYNIFKVWVFGRLFPKKRIGFLARFLPKSAYNIFKVWVFGALFAKKRIGFLEKSAYRLLLNFSMTPVSIYFI